ncbi:Glucose/arabinose dehydrogenase, beta-propeller fold [Geodermatophilus pulveris]|uniref:Glucose/arabinose dehydrogenase, beta-propeller fold n=1 Tax=Geodermatophilus pulveris TaxID=1564159 RepID=A0A239AQ72_9ACTN|nr:PQQ-dependent sugar dehydrogenase [Geodermatophilus pulveris]SNR97501.1 Glucose/arabinose dehydrogenase, beta-propeller fold [Geodermatophilus pulveris]
MRTLTPALLIGLVLVSGCAAPAAEEPDAAAPTAPASPAPPVTSPPTTSPAAPRIPEPVPALDVAVVADGLDHPWDVTQAPDGTLLFDERGGGLTAVLPDGTVRALDADVGDLFATGETGLMGLVLDPGFADSRRLYTCQGVREDGGAEVQVTAWTVDPGWTAATRVADPLVDDIPVNEDSGRHGGCRLRVDATGALLVSTGDTADPDHPQDVGSLAGKVLRVDPATGGPAPGNPFAGRPDADPRVWTYGHRNIQGLTIRPGSGEVLAAEHGPDRDDEVTLLRPGGNGAFAPVGPGYGEYVPMTDLALPGALPPSWVSGDSRLAPSGATFAEGGQWQAYEGLLLAGLLRGRGVLALRLAEDGSQVEQFRLPELDGTYGRIRTVQQGLDGALYVTTDNGDGDDQLLRVTPR